MTQSYPIIIEKSDDGYYAECPFIQGVYAEGRTEDEVKANLEDVMRMTLDDMKQRGEVVKEVSMPSITISSLTFAI